MPWNFGSSPRTRGTDRRCCCEMASAWFIPADAGNRRQGLVFGGSRSVHPRGRGEQGLPRYPHCRSGGSSPRTRGTVAEILLDERKLRFIPADAGNSSADLIDIVDAAVHPRGRGEQDKGQESCWFGTGSSPRTRGTASPACRASRPGRFIPADAGNRNPFAGSTTVVPVHPRGRGELCSKIIFDCVQFGSSPRTRGTGQRRRRRRLCHRFIPADAGNRSCDVRYSAGRSVHPRGRGEQYPRAKFCGWKPGSSPRTRGTAVLVGPPVHDVRFIPADAGNSQDRRRYRAAHPVHPRGRGEQRSLPVTVRTTGGSSPRTRGTDHQGRVATPLPRFIPADAGNRKWVMWYHRLLSVHPRGRGEQHAARDDASHVARFIPADAGNSCRHASITSKGPVHPRGRGEQGGMSKSL